MLYIKVVFLITDQGKIKTASYKKLFFSQVWRLRTPKNISYLWGFGRLLGVIMVIQVASGVVLAFYYVGGGFGWRSVIEITREVSWGWLLRLIHMNTASFVFFILFIHFFRGFTQGSFYLFYPWLRGWIIILFTMASAFLGYVLPWGQISFWGATVIINLLRILPIGKILVIWLWGGFYVSHFTCSFFFSLHFLLPFVVLGAAGAHLILLHFRGRSLPGGLRRVNSLKIKFSSYFSFKDLVNMSLLWGIWVWALASPDWSSDPVNFVTSDLRNSPLHIQPEWYFLHFYAVLRSIPNKIGGLIGFGMAIFLLTTLVIVGFYQSLNQFCKFDLVAWGFIRVNIFLIWLGIQPVEEPFIFLGQLSTSIYFLFLMLVLSWDTLLNLFF